MEASDWPGYETRDIRTGAKLEWSVDDRNRIGDHVWWITDTTRFESHYPMWKRSYDLERTLVEIRDAFARER